MVKSAESFKCNEFSTLRRKYSFIGEVKKLFALPFILFLCFALVPSIARSEVWKGHVRPILSRAFDRDGILLITAGSMAVGLSQSRDMEVRERFMDHRVLSQDLTNVGNFVGTGLPGIVIALSQLSWDTEGGIAHGEALVSTFLTTSLLKAVNQRNRPDSSNRESMPSGHTSTVFATATSLTYRYGWKVAIPSYSIGILAAASRWSEDAHWFSDTVAGALVGIFWGRATAQASIEVVPTISKDHIGLHWFATF